MDPGLAVILGATIGILGSAVVPWIRDALGQRDALKREERRALADAIRDLIQACARMVNKKVDRDAWVDIEEATARFALVAPPTDSAIVEFVAVATNRIQGRKLDGQDAYIVLTYELPRWYRGETTGEQARKRLDKALVSAEAEMSERA